MKKSTNIELENFNIQKEIETLLYNSQEAIFQYDALIYRLQSIIEALDSPISSSLSLVFNNIIDAYYLKIENKKQVINGLRHKIIRFNKIYDITKELNNYYYTEEEILKELNVLLA